MADQHADGHDGGWLRATRDRATDQLGSWQTSRQGRLGAASSRYAQGNVGAPGIIRPGGRAVAALSRERALTALCGVAGCLAPHRSSGGKLLRPIRRILVVKPCCLGDVVQLSPVIAALRVGIPEAQIDVATTFWCKPAVETNTHVHGVIELRWPLTGLSAFAGLLQNRRAIASRRYDLALVLDRSPSIGAMTLLAGIPERAGYDSLGRGFALNRRVRLPFPPRKHQLDEALAVVEALGLPVATRLPEFIVCQPARLRAARLLQSAGGEQAAPYALLAPGGGANPGVSMPEKRWRPTGFACLAKVLTRRGLRPVLIGGPSDLEVAQEVRSLASVPLLDLTGQTALGDLAAIMEASTLYVGNDSGT